MIKRTPLRIQINPIECGAAVLGIVLGYYKQNIPMHQLNSLVGVSRYGTDARALMRTAGFLGLKAYAQKILVSDLKKTRSLSILFVDNSHFVVFEGYFWGRFYINDPSRGRYNLSAEELRRRLSGMQIVLEPTERLIGKNTRRGFFENIMGVLGILLGALLGVIITILASNLALSMTESIKYMSLIIIFLIFLTFLCVIFLKISYLKFKSLYAQNITLWLLTNISKSASNFFTMRPFESFSRTIKNLSKLKNIKDPTRYLNTCLIAIILVIILAISFIYWPFGLMALILSLVSFLLASRKHFAQDLVGPSFAQAYEHYPDLAAMGQNQQLINTQMAFTARVSLSQEFSRNNYLSFISLWFALVTLFYWGSLNIQQGRLTALEIYTVLLLIIVLSFLAVKLAKNLSMSREEQDQALLTEIGELAISNQSKSYINSAYLLEITDGSFIYSGEQKAVFENFNLTLEESKIYAVKAAPMAGVSTLLKLLGQKLIWTNGDQRFKNNNMRIALIDDEADLFEGSLLENIRLFDRHVSEEEVVVALKRACAQELYYQRPMGLLAEIHQGGSNVSGGQKKRVLLARALTHKPDLIILDEFFETLEVELALKILGNLRALKQSVIFSSIRREEQKLADEIITLDPSL